MKIKLDKIEDLEIMRVKDRFFEGYLVLLWKLKLIEFGYCWFRSVNKVFVGCLFVEIWWYLNFLKFNECKLFKDLMVWKLVFLDLLIVLRKGFFYFWW